jgi:hypothetical protein
MTDVWDTEAELLASANGLPLEECREAVILKWMLEGGDLRPLRAALLRGDMLGQVIQQYLGAMLLDDNEEFYLIDDQTVGQKTSHQLIVRKRGPGRALKPENFVRDLKLSADVRVKIRLGLSESVEEAIAEVAREKGCSEGTVKQAYQKYQEAAGDD